MNPSTVLKDIVKHMDNVSVSVASQFIWWGVLTPDVKAGTQKGQEFQTKELKVWVLIRGGSKGIQVSGFQETQAIQGLSVEGGILEKGWMEIEGRRKLKGRVGSLKGDF